MLILTGIAGFLVPPNMSLTSGAAPYNIFHIIFGIAGLVIVWLGKNQLASLFNAAFGSIDLYQALASYLHLPPESIFHWTRVDDILHIVLGLMLLLIGCYGLLTQRRTSG